MLVDDLVRLAHRDGPVTILKHTQVLVVRVGEVVVKAHPPGTDERELRARLAAVRALPDLMLAPLTVHRLNGRLVTIWPAGQALTPDHLDAGDAPWDEGGRLLALLHTTAPPTGLPPAGGPARLARAVARLAEVTAHPAATAVIRAAHATLPPIPPPAVPRLTHGDWHLGQLVRYRGRWLLIDPDDLGVGDPAWDLARPAAWYAAGLLDPAAWQRLLSAYLAAGGTAVSRDDPWRELDLPARALTVQLAATAVATAAQTGDPLDDAATAVLLSCERIVATTTTKN